MDDLSQKIGEILSDPSMMEQIKSFGSMLGMDQQKPQQAQVQQSIQPQTNPLMNMSPDMMNMIMRFAPLMSSMNEENDSTRLLNALRPFLSEKRRSRIDGSIRLLSFMKMIPLLKGMMG